MLRGRMTSFSRDEHWCSMSRFAVPSPITLFRLGQREEPYSKYTDQCTWSNRHVSVAVLVMSVGMHTEARDGARTTACWSSIRSARGNIRSPWTQAGRRRRPGISRGRIP